MTLAAKGAEWSEARSSDAAITEVVGDWKEFVQVRVKRGGARQAQGSVGVSGSGGEASGASGWVSMRWSAPTSGCRRRKWCGPT